MKRQRLDNGGWFDREAAQCWVEDTWWNGNNHISVATGSQWAHQELWRTRSGAWVLHCWSQWQGSRPSWAQVSAAEAKAWLLAQGEEQAAEEFFPGAQAEGEV